MHFWSAHIGLDRLDQFKYTKVSLSVQCTDNEVCTDKFGTESDTGVS